jgi:hypothetical protein
MKTLLSLIALLWTVTAWSQPFTVDWFTSDSGGATSTGGTYALTGTIGQPDAATSSGGSFTLSGGFWSALQGRTEPNPELRVTALNSGNQVQFSWSGNLSGFKLQQTSALKSPIAWQDVAGSPTVSAGEYRLTIQMDAAARFFRLIKP